MFAYIIWENKEGKEMKRKYLIELDSRDFQMLDMYRMGLEQAEDLLPHGQTKFGGSLRCGG